MNKHSKIREKFNEHISGLFHLVLWPLVFTILLFVFTKGAKPLTIDFYYTLIFLLLIAVPILINFYVLIKFLLNNERYLYYITSLIALGVFFGFLLEKYFLMVIDFLFPNYFFVSYLGKNDFYLVLSIVLVATTFIKLTGDWLYFNRHQNELLKLEKQHIQTQLMALRNQVNPHFLFNSLNVIYALSLDKKDHIEDAIIELSDILRYVIYDSNTDRVALKDEVELLRNYVAFQKHRIDKTLTQLAINLDDDNYKIYPMLLLPLVENAYKYGASSEKPIEIKLIEKENLFHFSVLNHKVNINNILNEGYSGFGLKHLKKNLDIAYHGQHDLKIKDHEAYFKVELSLYKN